MAAVKSLPRTEIRTELNRLPVPPAMVLMAALLGFFVIGLDASAVNVALPAVGHTFGGSASALPWIVDAYTLMFAALLLSAGAVSDRVGANRTYAAGLAVFTLASAACGLAPGLGLLIVARLVQGSAAAVMLPSSLALVRQAYRSATARARAIALWTVGGAVSTAAGPIVGGALTTAVSWRAIFFLNLPVGVVTLIMLRRLPRSPRRARSLDPIGQVAAVVALAALTFGVIDGGTAGFGRPLVLGCLAISVLAFLAFLRHESRTAEPMVPLGLFRSRTVSACVTVGFAVNAVFYGLVFVVSLFFQERLGQSAVVAGLMFAPMTLVVAGSNVASARTAARFGPRVPIVVGQVVCALGLVGLLGVGTGTARPLIAVLLVPIGLGLGFAVPSLTAALLEDIDADRAGMAGGVLNSIRQTGGALAVAVFGSLLGHSFTAGMHASLLIALGMLALSIGAASTLPRRRTAPRQ